MCHSGYFRNGFVRHVFNVEEWAPPVPASYDAATVTVGAGNRSQVIVDDITGAGEQIIARSPPHPPEPGIRHIGLRE